MELASRFFDIPRQSCFLFGPRGTGNPHGCATNFPMPYTSICSNLRCIDAWALVLSVCATRSRALHLGLLPLVAASDSIALKSCLKAWAY